MLKPTIKKLIKRALKITGISILSILLLLLVLPYFFPKTIAESVKKWTNNNIEGKIQFSKLRLSFYNHFPSLTLSLSDFSLLGSVPYPKDTLVAAQEIAFGLNLKSIFFENRILIDRVYLDDARLNVQVDSLGNANYNILRSAADRKELEGKDTGSANLKIQKIKLSNCHLTYNDRSIPLFIDAKGFNYVGTGDLSNAIFDLGSKLNIEALDLVFDHEPYLQNKKIAADLITQINTNSLAFIFSRNDLRVNKLKLDFTGQLRFLSNGYLLDFSAGANNIQLYTLITALPPQYLKWLEKTKVKGNADLMFSLKGNYIASTGEKPDVLFKTNIRDGFISYENHSPASNLQFKFDTQLPNLNTDSLQINIDTFSFNVAKDYFNAKLHSIGLESPFIDAKLKMDLDLERLSDAIGYKAASLKGRFKSDINLKGRFVRENKKGLSEWVQIPRFSALLTLNNGYFKMPQLPQAVSDINFLIDAKCTDGDFKHTNIRIDNISAKALNNFIKGKLSMANLVDYPVDADFHSLVNLAELKSFIPMDSLKLEGQMKMDVVAKGPYDPSRKLFPEIQFDLNLQNGSVQTKYYPHPISDIQIKMALANPGGASKDFKLAIHPIQFLFEGKPFAVDVDLSNLENIRYDLQAKGTLDIGRIYAVFAQKDLNVDGFAQLDLNLSGTQNDLLNKKYARLNNSGVLQLQNLRVQHLGYLPLPFLLQQGRFAFRDDKFYFDKFIAKYGHSDLKLNGSLSNVINYVLVPRQKLVGNFNLIADFLLLDEFLTPTIPADTTIHTDSSGLFVVPENLNIVFNTNIKKAIYDGLQLDSIAGKLNIDSSKLKLKDGTFQMVGTRVNMNAEYQNVGTQFAKFAFDILAKDFDVKRAYKEVKMFKEMAPAAASAQGIISLDYKLAGKLNSKMEPIYPSLLGAGVLSVRNVKFKGFKLLNNASKTTGKEELKDPDVKNIQLKTSIKNNIISLEKVKIKMAGFRLKVEGQSDFDHHLRFKMRLGLPPLGIIGIPMTVSGTSDKPIIKVGKEEKEELTEVEDQLEDSQD